MMAALSDQLLVYAILAYTLAMLAYAVEYSFGTRSVVGRVATRELVGAGGPLLPDATDEIDGDPDSDAPAQPPAGLADPRGLPVGLVGPPAGLVGSTDVAGSVGLGSSVGLGGSVGLGSSVGLGGLARVRRFGWVRGV